MESKDNHEQRIFLAQDYDIQRAIVIETFNNRGHGTAHGQEIQKLAEIARQLHQAERVAGLPIGTTREGRR